MFKNKNVWQIIKIQFLLLLNYLIKKVLNGLNRYVNKKIKKIWISNISLCFDLKLLYKNYFFQSYIYLMWYHIYAIKILYENKIIFIYSLARLLKQKTFKNLIYPNIKSEQVPWFVGHIKFGIAETVS